MLIKTVCDGIGAQLLKEQDTTLEPFHKSGSTPPLEFLAAGWVFGQTSLSRQLVKASLKGGLEAVVELAEEKELGMVWGWYQR